MVRDFSKLAAPLARRISLMVGRGVLNLVNDAPKLQGVQIGLLADEESDNVERFQQYGFTSHPLPGAEAIAVSVGGSRDHVVVISIEDRRYRLAELQQGEVALYDHLGQKVHLKADGSIEVLAINQVHVTAPLVTVTASSQVTLDSPLVHATGRITADGDITDNISTSGRSMSGMRQIYDNHTHPHPTDGVTIPAPNEQM